MGAIGKFSFPTLLQSVLGGIDTLARKVLASLASHDESSIVIEPDAPEHHSGSILSASPESSLRLSVMMRRLGIVRDDIRNPRVLREIESNCASCDETSDCRDWLRSKKATGYHRFCLNALRFDQLLAARK